MGKLFGYVWMLLLGLIYFYIWLKVASDIKRAKEYWGVLEILKHLDIFSQIWIWGHIIILFLLSYSFWEGD